MKAELEKRDVEYEEQLAILESRQNTEIKQYVEQLADSESMKQSLESEVAQWKEKIELLREEVLIEHQDELEEAMRKIEREKMSLESELSKTTRDLELVRQIFISYMYYIV